MQDRLGISYKDAAHRLYMAEWERAKVDNIAQKAFSTLKRRTDETITKFEEKFLKICSEADTEQTEVDMIVDQ